MTSTITTQFLINTEHYQAGTNQYVYRLPQGKAFQLTNNHSVAVSSCSIYNSSFNIKSNWHNNRIVLLSDKLNIGSITATSNIKTGATYTDPVSGISIAKPYVEFIIDDGYYDVPALDAWIQSRCIIIGLYLKTTDNSGYSYFLECLTNPQKYACQLNLYHMPENLPSGYLMPSNACFSLGSPSSTLQVYFPNPPIYSDKLKYGNLGTIFGFKAQTVLPLSGNISLESQNLSNATPKVSPITSYILGCNLVKNNHAIPDDILLQLNLGSSRYGGIVQYNDFPVYVTCQNQMCSSIVISLYDERYNPLDIIDSQFSLVLSIREEIQRK
jgi:hypothetical protein